MLYADIKSGKVNISRLEENHPDGWIGQVRRDPGDVDVRGWYQPDEPDPWSTLNETAR